MVGTHKTEIVKDVKNKQLKITREFDAPVEKVWKAWTDSRLLDLWWAPKPWKAKTKSMDFREGGKWLYSMIGPDGTEQFCRADYTMIVAGKQFKGKDGFCDRDGNITNEFPTMMWNCMFSKSENGTLVEVEVTFDSLEDLEKIVEMGFKEGFTAAHGNLDEVLETM